MAIYYILYDRLDIFEGALLLASLLALIRGWWAAALVALAVAIDFKVYPAVLAPIWLVASLPAAALADWRRGAAATGPPARPAGSSSWAGPRPRCSCPSSSCRGPMRSSSWPSTPSGGCSWSRSAPSVLILLQVVGQPLQIIARYGAYEVVGPLAPALALASIPLTLLAVALVWWLDLRAALRSSRSGAGEPSPAGATDDPAIGRIVAVGRAGRARDGGGGDAPGGHGDGQGAVAAVLPVACPGLLGRRDGSGRGLRRPAGPRRRLPGLYWPGRWTSPSSCASGP